jgi:uncharacterized protein
MSEAVAMLASRSWNFPSWQGVRALLIASAFGIPAAATDAASEGKPAMTQSSEDAAEAANRAIVEAAFNRWSDGTGNPYELLADDCSWTIVGRSDASRTYASRKAFMDEVIGPFGARMSKGLRPTIRQLVTQGDAVVIFFDASGTAKDGQAYANTYAWFWEMRNGRVVKAHAFFDSIAFNELWRRVKP